MENTIENKQRFFALYMFQKVLRHGQYLDTVTPAWNWAHEAFSLELKPLSAISDEDLLWLGRNANDYPNSQYNEDLKYCKDLVRRYLSRPPMMNFEATDYLRSKGYLLPFMDLTIDQILAYKWAVIK